MAETKKARADRGEAFTDNADIERATNEGLAPVKEKQSNVKAAAEDPSDDTKCDNHPDRKGRNFTGGNLYSVNLCDECTPPWFTSE